MKLTRHIKSLKGMILGAVALLTPLAAVNAQNYCSPVVGSPNSLAANYGIGVGQLVFGNISHGIASINDYVGAYVDYYNTIADTITRGQSRSISITSGTTNANLVNVWIDLDNDGSFTNSEILFTSYGYYGTTSGTITIPTSVKTGPKRMRIGVEFAPYGVVNPCGPNAYGQFKDFQIVVINHNPGTDLGLFTIDNPVVFASGSNTLSVGYYNVGRDSIGSADLGFELSGSSAVNSTVSGASFNGGKYLQPGKRLSYTFGTAVSPVSGYYTLKVWGTKPNGASSDLVATNDTLSKYFCVGLKGSYTIGSGGDYASFSAAVTALHSCGIAGPVVFNVKPGTYNEQIRISYIVGAGGSNTVTFDGGDSTLVKLTYTGTGVGAAHTVQLANTKRIIFRNMQIHGLSSSYTFTVNLNNGADSNEFRKCIIHAPTVSSSNIIPVSTNDGYYYYNSSTSSKNIWDSCVIRGGYFAACIYGNNANYNNFYHNTVLGFTYYGIYSINNFFATISANNVITSSGNGYGIYHSGTNALIEKNRIGLNGTYASYGMSIQNNRFGRIEGNISYGNDYGIDAYDGTATSSGTNNTLINNIGYASNSNSVGIQYTASNASIWHNTGNGGSYGMYCGYGTGGNSIVNNIFESRNSSGYSMYIASSAYATRIDYNAYWSGTSSNLVYLSSPFGDLTSLKSAYSTWNMNSEKMQAAFASSSDFHLSTATAAKAGDPTLGVTLDVDGDARCSAAPSIGADESRFVVSTPKPNVIVPDTVWINSPLRMYSNAPKNGPFRNEWDLGNDGSIDGLDPYFDWAFPNPGWDSVKLKIQGCFGADSIVKYVWVDTPDVAPIPDFIADKNMITILDDVQLTDLTTMGAIFYQWTASPGAGVSFFLSDTEQNPKVSFSDPGLYEICLEATNDRGSNILCKSKYINVAAMANMCLYPYDTKGPSGFLYDEGGASGNYNGNYSWPYSKTICTFVIDPCATQVTTDFTYFSLSTINNGLGIDSLYIYDGADTLSGTLLGVYTGNNMPPRMVANSGKMAFKFVKHTYGYSAPGFAAKWTSTPATFTKPSLSIYVPKTIYTNVPFQIVARGASQGDLINWDFDYDGNDDEYDLTDTLIEPGFTYWAPGLYTVQLVVRGCSGTDTVTTNVTVVDPTTPPIADFESDFSSIEVGGFIQFTDKSTEGPTAWYWYSATDPDIEAYDMNPRIQFNTVGAQDITLEATNDLGSGTVTKTAYINVYDFCRPSVSTTHIDIGISKVTLDDQSNSSDQGKEDYTYYNSSIFSILERGTSHDVTVERNTVMNDMNRKVWIDWNRDGNFAASEEVLSESAAKTLSATASFTVPMTAMLGPSRMRVATSLNNMSNTPCGPNQYGEYEDYLVLISNDVSKPVITMNWKDTVTSEIGYAYVDSGATAFDKIDGVITSSIVPTSTVDINAEGTYTVTYNVSDAAGNAADPVKRVVIVTPDVSAPDIILFGGDTTVEVGDTYTDPGAVAIDRVDGDVTSTLSVTNPVNTSVVDTYLITYSARDTKGNMTGIVYRRVIVVDLIAPVISLSGLPVDTVEVFSTWTDPGATVTDNYYTGLTYSRTPFDTDSLGVFDLDYTAEDGSGNPAITQVRRVVVVDRTAPMVKFNGKDTLYVEVFSTFNDPGESVTDNYYTGLSALKTGSINKDIVDTYYIDYSVTDPSGNTGTNRRVVIVRDTKVPVITLKGTQITQWPRWLPYVDSGAVVTDNYYTGLTATSDDNVDVNTVGMYYVVYSAEDGSGNKAADVTRVVYVHELTNGIKAEDFAKTVSIYPNPTTGIVNVKWEGGAGTVSVVDVFGKLVKQQDAVVGTATLDLSDLAAGNYMIRLTTADQQVVKSINLVK